MLIRETEFLPEYLPLLLLADPEVQAVEKYIHRSRIFVCENHDKIVGIAAVTHEDGDKYELKNIAVQDNMQRCGIGKKLISAVKEAYSGCHLVVGTGNTSPAQKFYESCGFKKCGVIKNFFIDNYEEEIFEDGMQCVDMIIYEIDRLP